MEKTERCRASQWAGHVACMIRVTVLWWRKLKERNCWKDVDIDRRMILKWMGWDELGSPGSGQCKMAGSCETGFLKKVRKFSTS